MFDPMVPELYKAFPEARFNEGHSLNRARIYEDQESSPAKLWQCKIKPTHRHDEE